MKTVKSEQCGDETLKSSGCEFKQENVEEKLESSERVLKTEGAETNNENAASKSVF